MKKSKEEKIAFLNKIKSGHLSDAQSIVEIGKFLGEEEKTPLQVEVEDIWKQIKQYPDAKGVGVILIGKLKGRAMKIASDDHVEKARKIFDAAIKALSDG